MEILPFLFLGSAFHASKKDMLDGMGISALLNVSSNCPNHFEGAYQYKCIPVEDNHKEDISSWFIEAIDFIGELTESNPITRLFLIPSEHLACANRPGRTKLVLSKLLEMGFAQRCCFSLFFLSL